MVISCDYGQSKKFEIGVRISKMNMFAAVSEKQPCMKCFQNKFVLRRSHQDAFFSIAVCTCGENSLKNTCD